MNSKFSVAMLGSVYATQSLWDLEATCNSFDNSSDQMINLRKVGQRDYNKPRQKQILQKLHS